jgi:hypothetical protein
MKHYRAQDSGPHCACVIGRLTSQRVLVAGRQRAHPLPHEALRK